MLPGDVGLEWAQLFPEHRRLISAGRVPPFTLFRFRQGEYGSRTLADGSVDTGGLQQHMLTMDRALAEVIPVSIHSVFTTDEPRASFQIKEPYWRGSITVHPICPSADWKKAIHTIRELLAEINPDLVHIHHPHNAIDRAIIDGLPKDIGVVASYHGAPAPVSITAPGKRGYLEKLLGRYGEYRETLAISPALYQTIVDSVDFVSRRLLGIDLGAQRACSAALRHGHGTYQVHNLSAVSQAGQQDLASFPSIVVHPPVDTDFFSPERVTEQVRTELRRLLGVPEGRPIFSYHARICPDKGQACLPEVIAEVRKLTDVPFSVVLVGPEYEVGALEHLKTEIARYGQADSFILMSGRSQEFIRDLLSISTLCLFPSFNEGLGRTAVEAQLMKVPVIAHDVGGIPEVVRHKATGCLVKPRDTLNFAREICTLLASPELRSEYGQNGRAFMINEFDYRSIAARVLENLYLPQLFNTRRALI